ncbi:MAG: glutaredoxin family protein [Pseudomonadota bacterium]
MLILYSTDGCHLCELAESLLRASVAATEEGWELVDIALDDALFERYGWSIPVIRSESGEELAWPFDPEGLAAFLS